METIYVYNRSLEARLNKLTFGELKEMFPTVSTALYLPRPESLLENRKNRFLEVEETDFSIRIYRSGLFLYQEQGEATAYSVRKCARILFPSVEDEYYAESETDDLLWFWPLKMAGEYRIERNQNSRECYNRNLLHFEEGIPDNLMPYTPDFVRDSSPEMEEQHYEQTTRLMYHKLLRVMKCLTPHQRQIFHLRFGEQMKLNDIAKRLGIGKAAVTRALQRASNRIEKVQPR